MIKFIDLFAGIGGFRYGFEKARKYIQEQRTSRNGIRPSGDKSDINSSQKGRESSDAFSCVYSNEWDKYASDIYKKHYGECDTRDITKVPSSDIPDHDLLVGGFPCQAFSIAGKRRGFEDTRGTLFFEIARILHDKRPRYFILENVKGLLSHEEGKTFQTILGVLTDLGYECEWQVLNSKNFGVPQNRERVFIVGHTRGIPRPKVFP
ncbi:MAG: DNA (cytosine-5-)-methyltransferase, partial [Patescibacteria group bacterium]